MPSDLFSHGDARLSLPAPHPERVFAWTRGDAGALAERQTLRFLHLGDDEAGALLAWHRAACAHGDAFAFADENGRSWPVRAIADARPVRHAPGDWTVELTLETAGAVDADDPADGAGGSAPWSGWVRFADDAETLWMPLAAPAGTAHVPVLTRARVAAVGEAADGTRHVHDGGRVRLSLALSLGPVGAARRARFAAFYDRHAAAGEPFAFTDPDGAAAAWHFADAPAVFARPAPDAWRVDVALRRDAADDESAPA